MIRLGSNKSCKGGQCDFNDVDIPLVEYEYDSISDVGEIRVYQRADFQSGSRVLKKVF